MGYEFSPFNPLIWLLFFGFCVATYVIVKLFHHKYPHYPNIPETEDELEEAQDAQSGASPLSQSGLVPREEHQKVVRTSDA